MTCQTLKALLLECRLALGELIELVDRLDRPNALPTAKAGLAVGRALVCLRRAARHGDGQGRAR